MKTIKRIALGLTALLGASLLLAADTSTTRIGLTKPALQSSGWAQKNNANFDIIDSSVAVQAGTNAFTGSNSFSGTVSFPSLTPSQCLQLDSNNQVTSQACITPPGSDTQVIYNQGGTFAGDSDFTFNGTTISITGIIGSTMTIRRIVWPDGSVQVSSPTSTQGANGADGTSVYPATSTASFPYGLSASTVAVSTLSVTTMTDAIGTTIMTTGSSVKLFVSSITFPDGTIINSTSPFSASIDAILNRDTLQTGTSFYTYLGRSKKMVVDSTFTVTGDSITLGTASSNLSIPAMGTASKFIRAGNGSTNITPYDLLGGTQTWSGTNTYTSSSTAWANFSSMTMTGMYLDGTTSTMTFSSATITNLFISSVTIPSGYLTDTLSLFPQNHTIGVTYSNYYNHAQLNSSLGYTLGGRYFISGSSGTTFDVGALGGAINFATTGGSFGYGGPTGVSVGLSVGTSGSSFIGGYTSFASSTTVGLQQTTPSAVNQMWYLSDGTNAFTCISTGTVKGSYASMQATNRTTACN